MTQSTRERLLKLPKAPSNDFSNGLPQNIIGQQEDFRCAVRATAPEFCPFERHRACEKKLSAKLDFLVSEEGTHVEDYPDRKGQKAKKTDLCARGLEG